MTDLPLFAQAEPEPEVKGQCAEVLRYLRRHGSITPREAMEELHCYRLAARIYDLRDAGYRIETQTEKHQGGTHARYRMEAA